MSETSLQYLQSVFHAQRSAFQNDSNPTLATRKDRLNRLYHFLEKYEDQIVIAVDQDFSGRSSHETRLAELIVVRSSIKHAIKHLAKWMKPKRIATALQYWPAYNRLFPQALGVIGIVSAWNYPLQLLLGPAVGAMAAGNRVMLKPSEFAPHLSELLVRAMPEFFPLEELAVVTGDVALSEAFVSLPFNHLCFTGSTRVGREVAIAAARNLTPVTLELGGKSPAIIDVSCTLDDALPKVVFGKFFNAGQTCIAPDYLLVPKGQADDIAKKLVNIANQYYPTIRDNPDYTSIVSSRHRQRLFELVVEVERDGGVVYVANSNKENFEYGTNKIPPTFILNAKPHHRILQEEIFGPLLPIIEYESLEDALAYVNDRPRPLALYWFGQDPQNRDLVLTKTISGGVTVNDCLLHIAQEDQPFGGVGDSGMGAYHGVWGFKTFSKEKPVFYQSRFSRVKDLRPPYGAAFDKVMNLLKKLN